LRGLSCSCLAAVTMSCLSITEAQVLDDRYEFHIETGTLGSALEEIVDTTNVQLLYPHDLSNAEGFNPVIGQYTIEEALEVLLGGTNFSGGLTTRGVIVIALNSSGQPQEEEANMPIGEKSKRNALYAGAAAAALVLGNQQALAQEEAEVVQQDESRTMDTIVVTGIRKSLTDAAAIKRNSDGVVDAISAEDIGKFPDTNLAESLQRITGVSIDRSNGEGNQITVRGLGPSFNLVTLNGRQMPKASTQADVNINRGFNFRDVSSEMVSGVHVMKTGRADIVSGGMGATVDVVTAKPLELGERKISLSAKGVMDTTNEVGDDVTPELFGLYSDVFLNGKLGVLLSASHAERNSRVEIVKTDGWVTDNGTAYTGIDASNIDRTRNPDGIFFVPRNWVLNVGDHKRERQNYQAVVQFEPVDNFRATVDYAGTRFEDSYDELEASFWFDSDAGTTGVADVNGTVTSPRHNDHRLNFAGINKVTEVQNDSYGVNFEWEPTDNLSLAFDYHNSTSESQPDGTIGEVLTVLSGNTFDVDIGIDLTGAEVPTTIADDGDVPNGNAYSKESIQADVSVGRGRQIKNEVEQFQFDAEWKNSSDSAIRSVKTGLAYTEFGFDQIDRFFFAVVDSVDISSLSVDFVPRGSIASDFSGTETFFPFRAIYDPAQLNQLVDDAGLLFDVEGTLQPTVSGVTEKTLSGYVSVDIEEEFNGFPVDINAGVRFEKTEVTGGSSLPFDRFAFLSNEALEPVAAASASSSNLTGEYTEFLPNLDVKVDLMDDLILRASYSRTISRSDLGLLAAGVRLVDARPGGPFTAETGDPGLLPFSSNNVDLSVEWYYGDRGLLGAGEGSYFSTGFFKKYVDNFIGVTAVERPVLGAGGQPFTDPSVDGGRPGCPDSTGQNDACLSQPTDPQIIFDVLTPQNLESAEINGFEIALQHIIGESGFGFIANATFVDSDAEYDIFSFNQSVALEGLSDSANLVAFYDKYGFQARVAYNWRDEFLLQQNQFHSAAEPVFVKAYGQVDVSASYDINENFSVFLEGLNLTDENIFQHGRFENQFLKAEKSGPRYNFGVRATF